MRDMYKLLLWVPIIIVLMVFAVRLTDGKGDTLHFRGIGGHGESEQLEIVGIDPVSVELDVDSSEALFTIAVTPQPAPLSFTSGGAGTPHTSSELEIRAASGSLAGIELDLDAVGTKARYTIGIDKSALGSVSGTTGVSVDGPLDDDDGDGDDDDLFDDITRLNIEGDKGASVEVSDPQTYIAQIDIEGPFDAAGQAHQVLVGRDRYKGDWQPVATPTADQHLAWDASSSTIVWTDAPVVVTRAADVTLTASQISSLSSTRIEVIPAPGSGKYLVVHDIIIIKTGNATISDVSDVNMGLAFVNSLTGLLPTSVATYNRESTGYRSIYSNGVSDSFGQWFYDGDYVKYVAPAGEYGYLMNENTALVVYGNAPQAQDWTTAVSSIGNTMTVRLLVRYEVIQP